MRIDDAVAIGGSELIQVDEGIHGFVCSGALVDWYQQGVLRGRHCRANITYLGIPLIGLPQQALADRMGNPTAIREWGVEWEGLGLGVSVDRDRRIHAVYTGQMGVEWWEHDPAGRQYYVPAYISMHIPLGNKVDEEAIGVLRGLVPEIRPPSRLPAQSRRGQGMRATLAVDAWGEQDACDVVGEFISLVAARREDLGLLVKRFAAGPIEVFVWAHRPELHAGTVAAVQDATAWLGAKVSLCDGSGSEDDET